MLSVEEITDPYRFEEIKEEWNALASAAGLSIFQTWEWSWCWWKTNGKGKKLWILAVRDGNRLVGIAPFYVSNSCYGLPVKVVSFIGTNGTDYLDLIIKSGPNGESAEATSKLIDHLLTSTKWDAIDLHQIPAKSETADLISSEATSRGLSCEQIIQDPCYSLSLPGSWDDYLAGLSKKFRWNVQYYARRLARDHNIAFRISDSANLKKDIELFFKLHQKRFISKRKPGAYLNPRFRRFHAELTEAICRNDWLRLYVLEIDDKPVAVLYGFKFGGSFYYYLGGFEPDWGAMSVSTVLIAKAIEDSISDGLSGFDFLRGDEPYKLKWLAKESFNRRLIISRSDKKSGFAQKILTLENDITKRAKDRIGS